MADEQDEGTGTTPVAAGAHAERPGGTAPQPPTTVDLTSLPEFRSYQANQDRRFGAAQQTIQQLETRVNELAGKVTQREAIDIDKLDPQEQVVYYRDQAEQQRRANAQIAEQQRINTRMGEIVNRSGLDWQKEPRLQAAIALGPTQGGLDAVQAAVVEILADRNREASTRAAAAEEEARKKIDTERQRGRVEGIASTGATTTSLGSGKPVIQETEHDRLVAVYQKKYNAMRGTGWDNPDYLKLLDSLKRSGIRLEEIEP